MFGNNKTKEKNNLVPSSAPINGLNSLVVGTVIEGHLTSENDIRIDGIIRGSIDCKAKVIIGPQGRVEGTINCSNAMIEGQFEGILNVSDTLDVRKDAKINGEMSIGKLSVETGASFNGTCNMGQQSAINGGARKEKGKLTAQGAFTSKKQAS